MLRGVRQVPVHHFARTATTGETTFPPTWLLRPGCCAPDLVLCRAGGGSVLLADGALSAPQGDLPGDRQHAAGRGDHGGGEVGPMRAQSVPVLSDAGLVSGVVGA